MCADRPAALGVRRLGRRAFEDVRALERRVAREVGRGGPDQLILAEHPPVVTIGRGGGPAQLLASPEELRRRGIRVVETDRGGGVTYHGPGQIVGYPIVDLRRRGLGVRGYLRTLEAALVEAVRAEGLEVWSRPGLTGVWSSAGKVAAIGIAVRRGVSRHGFALNVAPDLSAYELIVPCGLSDPVTSMARLGWDGSPARLTSAIVGALVACLDETGEASRRPSSRIVPARARTSAASLPVPPTHDAGASIRRAVGLRVGDAAASGAGAPPRTERIA